MVTIIICTVIVFVLVFIGRYQDVDDFFESLFGGFFISFFGALLGLIIALIIPSVTENSVDIIGLASLQDNSNLEGDFFLGCGSINEKMAYTYYYESDGGYRMGQKEVNEVLIKLTKDKPRIEIHQRKQTNALINKFSIILSSPKYIFYIPENSIKQNYTLDTQ